MTPQRWAGTYYRHSTEPGAIRTQGHTTDWPCSWGAYGVAGKSRLTVFVSLSNDQGALVSRVCAAQQPISGTELGRLSKVGQLSEKMLSKAIENLCLSVARTKLNSRRQMEKTASRVGSGGHLEPKRLVASQ